MFKKSKNSPHWNSPRSLELQALLKSVKLEDAEQDEYVQSSSRGGLWSPNENIKGIAESAEMSFRKHIMGSKADVTTSIPVDKIVDEILMQPVVLSLWENITLGLGFTISTGAGRTIIEGANIRGKQSKTKALRTQLKKQAKKM